MSKDLEQLSLVIESNLKAAEEARAYISITNEQGPSEQLLAFINFDGKLEEEIGLEGYNALSLQARHEILLSKLNPDAMEAVAIENLYEKIAKISKYSLYGTAYGGSILHTLLGEQFRKLPQVTQVKTAVGFLGVVFGIATIAWLNDTLHKAVIPYKNMAKIKESMQVALELDKEFYSKMPSDFSVKSWQIFYDKTMNVKSSFANKFDKWEYKDTEIKYDELTPLRESGWTIELLTKELKWFAETIDMVSKQTDLYKPKVEKINNWIKDNKNSSDPETKQVIKLISKTLRYVNYSLMTSSVVLPKIKKIFKILLKRVSFEKAKIG